MRHVYEEAAGKINKINNETEWKGILTDDDKMSFSLRVKAGLHPQTTPNKWQQHLSVHSPTCNTKIAISWKNKLTWRVYQEAVWRPKYIAIMMTNKENQSFSLSVKASSHPQTAPYCKKQPPGIHALFNR